VDCFSQEGAENADSEWAGEYNTLKICISMSTMDIQIDDIETFTDKMVVIHFTRKSIDHSRVTLAVFFILRRCLFLVDR